jgi:dTDP-glucose 4,6-dehydratase
VKLSSRDAILVTGGAGFIGSNFILQWLASTGTPVVNLDVLTYAGNLENLRSIEADARYEFVHGDICDRSLVAALLTRVKPRAVLHFAAETHVDRSILEPGAFLRTNVEGTYSLLDAARVYFDALDGEEQARFRFLHVSTDEVYGSLAPEGAPFTEDSQYAPNSPYAASKASSDMLVRSYHHTYGLPVLTTNCSNNYGRFQFPEKLIPLVVLNALEGVALPVYGDGQNVRDWLFVEDHCSAIRAVLERGRIGETYNIGGASERTNLDVVLQICAVLDALRPASRPREELIQFVADRPGHDRRYAINASKVEGEIGWRPTMGFEDGMRQTIQWYLDHPEWIDNIRTGAYLRWVEQNYVHRVAR